MPSLQESSHHSIVLYPSRNAETEERQALRDTESARYLQARPKGFLFLRWLKNDKATYPDVTVGLFASVDIPHELVIIKKVLEIRVPWNTSDAAEPLAPEIELSSLSTNDPLVQRQLPLFVNETPTPFIQTHAIQLHQRGSRSQEWKDVNVTVFYKYYNGGSIGNLIYAHTVKGKPIPESLIWHFAAQIGRAFAWMHTGHYPSREYNLHHKDDIGDDLTKEVNTAKSVHGWEPISHGDAHKENIWLHYPTDDEKKADPRLDVSTDSMPQMILGEYGFALQAQHDRRDMFCRATNPGIPEAETLRDKSDLARILVDMMLAHLGHERSRLALDTHRKGESGTAEQAFQHHFASAGYSLDLQRVLYKLLYLRHWNLSKDFYPQLNWTTGEEWGAFPSNDYLYGTLIAMADNYLDKLEQNRTLKSVRWTKPVELYMPYHAERRAPPQHRRDWAEVQGHLKAFIEHKFSDCQTGSVEVVQTHVRGGVLEEELSPVDLEGVAEIWKQTEKQEETSKPEKQRQHGPDSLSHYVDSDDVNRDGGGQPTAGRASVVPLGSPSTPRNDHRNRSEVERRGR
ncbi:hypothetical protein VTI74DRAFT_11148 [Chaetomium olivicolor]